jgi:hypothetical protein
MSYWDYHSGKIIRFKPRKVRGHPNWEFIDCGCCAGIMWGGDYPRECKYCGGSGWICRHKKSGVLAWYPGGPFCGREPYKNKGA